MSIFGFMPIFASQEAMLDSLQGVISSEQVHRAFEIVKRNYFVPQEQEELTLCAYPFPIRLPTGRSFNMSAINIYAVYMEYLNLQPGLSVLDIGCGTCFSTALIRYLVGDRAHIDACDLFPDIVEFGKQNLKRFSQETGISVANIHVQVSNGMVPRLRKYDRIYCGASCPPKMLQSLYDLLDRKGILVTPCGDQMLKIEKDAQGNVSFASFMDVRFGELVVPTSDEMHRAFSLTNGMYSKYQTHVKRGIKLGYEDVTITCTK